MIRLSDLPAEVREVCEAAINMRSAAFKYALNPSERPTWNQAMVHLLNATSRLAAALEVDDGEG